MHIHHHPLKTTSTEAKSAKSNSRISFLLITKWSALFRLASHTRLYDMEIHLHGKTSPDDCYVVAASSCIYSHELSKNLCKKTGIHNSNTVPLFSIKGFAWFLIGHFNRRSNQFSLHRPQIFLFYSILVNITIQPPNVRCLTLLEV
jgi:hypothetical protein